MSENVDQLKAFELDARQNLSTDRVLFNGLAEARAHQRGEWVPKKPGGPRKFTDEQKHDMIYSTDPLRTVAARHNTTPQTVRNYRNGTFQ